MPVLNSTAGHSEPQYNVCTRRTLLRRTLMLIFIGVMITLTTALIIRKVRVPGGVNSSNLGEVSEQWLAEHRASHPL